VDALTDERGQAHFIVVLALAIGVIAVVGLRAWQDRIVRDAHDQRAGEAAVEAAAQSLADAYAAEPDLARRIASDPRSAEAARVAAAELARANGVTGVEVENVSVRCVGSRLEAELVLSGHTHRAGFTAPECSQP
jgi:hypothetical protein